MKGKLFRGTLVMPGTRLYELLESKDPADQKKAKRLAEFCEKAYNVGYEYNALTKLRQEYSDVV